MPRIARRHSYAPGAIVHVIIRFVDGRFLFDDAARCEYLRRLERALRRTDWKLISYALMSSHIHLAFIHGKDELVVWAKPLNVGIAQWLNQRRRRSDPRTLGHVIADRPKDRLYSVEHAGIIIAYHHNNPGKGNVVSNPSDSTWTSHRAYVGLVAAPPMLHVDEGLRLCGFSSDRAGRVAFHEFVCARAGCELTVEPIVPTHSVEVEARPHRPSLVPADVVVRTAADALGVPVEAVRGRGRRPCVVSARRVSFAAWYQLGGRTSEMARYLGVSQSGATKLLESCDGRADIRALTTRVVGLATDAHEHSLRGADGSGWGK